NFNARHAEPSAVAPDARVNFNARHAEPSAVAPDAKVNFKHLPSGIIRTSEGWKLIGAACNKSLPPILV
ncbi:MAG TPA: hypothetical protein VGJ66_21940, partial [Pyrinomonadaceae bacterium]